VRTYQSLYRVTCSVLAVAGWLVASAVSLEALVAVVLGSAMAGSLGALTLWSAPTGTADRRWLAVMARGAVLVGTVAGATLGLSVALGSKVLLVGLCLLVGSPHCVRRYHAWLRSAPRPSTPDVQAIATALCWASPAYVPLAPAVDLRMLPQADLRQRWYDSCRELSRAGSPSRLEAAALDRADILDELERRDPAGFAAWLSSSASLRADGLPQDTGACAGADTVDWDALTRGED
jgi:hypothetical protein